MSINRYDEPQAQTVIDVPVVSHWYDVPAYVRFLNVGTRVVTLQDLTPGTQTISIA